MIFFETYAINKLIGV